MQKELKREDVIFTMKMLRVDFDKALEYTNIVNGSPIDTLPVD